jgi:hypothetical protein
MFGIGGLKMPYKIFVEETVRLKHLITVECDEDIIEYIPDPDDFTEDISDYAYNMLDDIDGLTVLSVEEEIDRYDCDCFELDDIIPCEEGN